MSLGRISTPSCGSKTCSVVKESLFDIYQRMTLQKRQSASCVISLPSFIPPPRPCGFPLFRTWVVPAASSSAASPPLSLIVRGAPFLQLGVLQGVSCQVAELQAAKLTQEVTERHPEGQK